MPARISDLSVALSDTLVASNLESLTVPLAESIADTFLEEGVVKELPIVGTIVGLAKVGVSIRDRLFIKKLLYFLAALPSVPVDERVKIISRIDESRDFRTRVGEKLLYILDRSEDHENARIIGHLFGAFLRGDLSYGEFLHACAAIQVVTSEDLLHFVESDEERGFLWWTSGMMSAGLFEIDELEIRVEDEWDWKRGDNYRVEGQELTASITPLGKKVRGLLRSCWSASETHNRSDS